MSQALLLSCIDTLIPGRFSFKLFKDCWKVFEKVFHFFPGVWQAKAESDNTISVGVYTQCLNGI